MGAGPAMQAMAHQQARPMQQMQMPQQMPNMQQSAAAARAQMPQGIAQSLSMMDSIYGQPQQSPQQMPNMQQSGVAARAQMPQQMPNMRQQKATGNGVWKNPIPFI